MSLIEALPSKYAKPSEFDQGKRIKFVNFESLTLDEVTERDGRPPMFPPKSGILQRLTFTQDGYEKERTMDINSISIRNDLAGKVKEKGEIGILTRHNTGKTNKFGKPVYKWTWEPTT